MPYRRYVEDIGLAVMLAAKRSTGESQGTCNIYASAKCE